jgi:hypothetical protein
MRISSSKIPALAAACVIAAAMLAAQTTQPLFTIERSKNANVLHYEANLTAQGELDPKEPIVIYWIMKAEKGQR